MTLAVLAFCDYEINSTFDVGIVLMDRSSDIAVGDGAGELPSEPPFFRQGIGDNLEMLCVHCGCVVIHKTHGKLSSLEHGLDEGASSL